MKTILLPVALVIGLIAGLGAQTTALRFEVDPAFPQLPAGKVLGDMSSVTVDSHDHIWMIHRPRTIPEAQRANAAGARGFRGFLPALLELHDLPHAPSLQPAVRPSSTWQGSIP